MDCDTLVRQRAGPFDEPSLDPGCRARRRATPRATSVALLAPGRTAASYGDLLDQLEEISRYLRAAGIARNGRVAVAMPNGSRCSRGRARHGCRGRVRTARARSAGRRVREAVTALGARAVMVLRGHDTPAHAAASSLGIPVIELEPRDTAGTFALSGLAPGEVPPSDGGSDTDAALLLFTSGTTGRPKLVPLTSTTCSPRLRTSRRHSGSGRPTDAST